MKRLSEYDWYCDECNDYLNHQLGFNAYCGYWTCSKCGYSNKIGKSEIIFDTDTDSFYSTDNNVDIPAGCSACGGPYPNCKSSCPLFDD